MSRYSWILKSKQFSASHLTSFLSHIKMIVPSNVFKLYNSTTSPYSLKLYQSTRARRQSQAFQTTRHAYLCLSACPWFSKVGVGVPRRPGSSKRAASETGGSSAAPFSGPDARGPLHREAIMVRQKQWWREKDQEKWISTSGRSCYCERRDILQTPLIIIIQKKRNTVCRYMKDVIDLISSCKYDWKKKMR